MFLATRRSLQLNDRWRCKWNVNNKYFHFHQKFEILLKSYKIFKILTVKQDLIEMLQDSCKILQ